MRKRNGKTEKYDSEEVRSRDKSANLYRLHIGLWWRNLNEWFTSYVVDDYDDDADKDTNSDINNYISDRCYSVSF